MDARPSSFDGTDLLHSVSWLWRKCRLGRRIFTCSSYSLSEPGNIDTQWDGGDGCDLDNGGNAFESTTDSVGSIRLDHPPKLFGGSGLSMDHGEHISSHEEGQARMINPCPVGK